jgi:hypothetical protein
MAAFHTEPGTRFERGAAGSAEPRSFRFVPGFLDGRFRRLFTLQFRRVICWRGDDRVDGNGPVTFFFLLDLDLVFPCDITPLKEYGDHFLELFDLFLERGCEGIEPVGRANVVLQGLRGLYRLHPEGDDDDVVIEGTLDLAHDVRGLVRDIGKDEDEYTARIDGVIECFRKVLSGKDVPRCHPAAVLLLFEAGAYRIRHRLVL